MENVVTRQSVQKQTQDLESNIASYSILKKIKIKNPQIKGDIITKSRFLTKMWRKVLFLRMV